MKAEPSVVNGFGLVTVRAEARTEYLSVVEARDLSHQLSRAAAIAEAQNRARAKEPVTS